MHPSEGCLQSQEWHLSSERFGFVTGASWRRFIKSLGTWWGQDLDLDEGETIPPQPSLDAMDALTDNTVVLKARVKFAGRK